MLPDLDAWWAEQASRRPKRFQLWRAPRMTPTVLLSSSDHEETIVRQARAHGGPCVVVDTTDGRRPLGLDARGKERGPWAGPTPVAMRIAAAEAMRRLEDGAPVRRRLGLHAEAARQAAIDLRLGHVIAWGVWHPLPGGQDRGPRRDHGRRSGRPESAVSGRTCRVCRDPIDHLRAHAEVCRRTACRRAEGRRKASDDGSTVSEEDRAAIRLVLERDGHGCPLPIPTPEQIRAHILATAERT